MWARAALAAVVASILIFVIFIVCSDEAFSGFVENTNKPRLTDDFFGVAVSNFTNGAQLDCSHLSEKQFSLGKRRGNCKTMAFAADQSERFYRLCACVQTGWYPIICYSIPLRKISTEICYHPNRVANICNRDNYALSVAVVYRSLNESDDYFWSVRGDKLTKREIARAPRFYPKPDSGHSKNAGEYSQPEIVFSDAIFGGGLNIKGLFLGIVIGIIIGLLMYGREQGRDNGSQLENGGRKEST